MTKERRSGPYLFPHASYRRPFLVLWLAERVNIQDKAVTVLQHMDQFYLGDVPTCVLGFNWLVGNIDFLVLP
jgi:hypothetical protein